MESAAEEEVKRLPYSPKKGSAPARKPLLLQSANSDALNTGSPDLQSNPLA